jgi:hypothetical protein
MVATKLNENKGISTTVMALPLHSKDRIALLKSLLSKL